jgi:hypothetical protein
LDQTISTLIVRCDCSRVGLDFGAGNHRPILIDNATIDGDGIEILRLNRLKADK